MSTSKETNALDFFPHGVIVINQNKEVVGVNSAFLDLTGFEHDEIIKFNLHDLFPSITNHLLDEIDTLFSGKSNFFSLERSMQAKHNKNFWVEINARRPQNFLAAESNLILSFTDMTHLKEAERLLAKSDSKYRLVEMATSDVIWDMDYKTKTLRWNNSVREIFGYSEKVISNEYLWWINRIHIEDRDRIADEIKRALTEKRKHWIAEYRFRKADGSYVHLLDKAYMQYDTEMNLVRIVGAKKDVTELKRYEQELEKAKQEAQQAAQAKSEFLATISHEIRTPLSAILGFTDLLMQLNMDEIDQRQSLFTIQRNTQHLLKLINDVLDLSKIESGLFEFERVFFSPHQLLDRFYSKVKSKAELKKINLFFEVDPLVPRFLKSDPMRLEQILQNLVEDVIEFTQSGFVKIVVTFVQPGAKLETFLKFQIQDAGTAVDAPGFSNLLEESHKSEHSADCKFGGTGLGLYMSRKLARLLGGDIELILSPVRKGSTFELKLQAGREDEVQRFNANFKEPEQLKEIQTLERSQSFNFEDLKILVVEDSPDNRMWIRHILDQTHAKVSLASNGDEGMKQVLTDSPDIILMDLQMPVMGGYEATQKLRDLGYQKPIIALTGHDSQKDRESCMKAGFSEHLSKPIDRKSLMKMIDRYRSHSEQTNII